VLGLIGSEVFLLAVVGILGFDTRERGMIFGFIKSKLNRYDAL
jgi:hypothetical protein